MLQPPTSSQSAATSQPERSTVFFLWLLWSIWLLFFIPALLNLGAIAATSPAQVGLAATGVLLFFALYLWASWRNAARLSGVPGAVSRVQQWEGWWPLASLTLLSIGLPLLVQTDWQDWSDLFIFTSAYAGGRYGTRLAMLIIAGLAGLSLVVGQILGSEWEARGRTVAFILVVGVAVLGLVRIMRLNAELRVAREEIRRLAVTTERLRIARDLHDLLGHNLALITLKSELARRLLDRQPQQAKQELSEIETAARHTLQEVREAVASYRQPTLGQELAGAEEFLAAAGINYHYVGDQALLSHLPPALDTVLGWVVREGVTNVIKHSQARQCVIAARLVAGEVRLTISNDGVGGQVTQTQSGHGLQGLRERLAAVGGRATTELVGGEFELVVIVPKGIIPTSNRPGS